MHGRTRRTILTMTYNTESPKIATSKVVSLKPSKRCFKIINRSTKTIKRIGEPVMDAAEIFHANLSWRDGKWSDHAMQWMAPKIVAMAMEGSLGL